MRKAEPTHVMRTFPADMESPTRREADSLPLTGLPQRPVTCLVVNRLDLAMEVFERSLEPADDDDEDHDDEDDADTEADDEDGDEDDADTDEHEHGGEA
jgi:ABC-type Zn2+ transport system substrate-binding protein/surface adhesin